MVARYTEKNVFPVTPTQMRNSLLGRHSVYHARTVGFEGVQGSKHRKAVAGALKVQRSMAKYHGSGEGAAVVAAYKRGVKEAKLASINRLGSRGARHRPPGSPRGGEFF